MSIQPLGRSEFGRPEDAGNVPTREEALALLNDWVTNERLRLHMHQVAAVMKAWALEKESATEAESHAWWVAGLLHDADWEAHPEAHCRIIVEELERRRVDPAVIRCIASHGPRFFGVDPVSRMDHMIYAFDELSGFIHAAALVRPPRYEGMDVKGITKKLKTPGFAAQVSREDITDASARSGVPVEELIAFIITHQAGVTLV